jgi:hypothetical protein
MSKNKIDDLLNSVGVQQTKLDELEQYYKENKELITKQLASHIQDLAVSSDTQAIRAKVVRELYWEKQISTTLIGSAFALSPGRIRKIAGSKTVSFPCDYQCGNSISETFGSRSHLETSLRSEHKRRNRSSPNFVYYRVCKDCEKREKTEREAEEQLRAMSWEDFIETKEWIETRNSLFHEKGYKCEVCRTDKTRLHIYLGKDTPQDAWNYYDENYRYFILCGDCVPRFADIINPEKGETIKREFMSRIMEWNQGYR